MVPQRGLRAPLVVPVVWRVSSMETGAWKTQEAQVRALLRVDIRSWDRCCGSHSIVVVEYLDIGVFWFFAPNNVRSRESI